MANLQSVMGVTFENAALKMHALDVEAQAFVRDGFSSRALSLQGLKTTSLDRFRRVAQLARPVHANQTYPDVTQEPPYYEMLNESEELLRTWFLRHLFFKS